MEIEVELKDGVIVRLAGTQAQIMLQLNALIACGITPDDIAETRHLISIDLPHFTCGRCGRTSYNANDVREGYCGHCHDWTR